MSLKIQGGFDMSRIGTLFLWWILSSCCISNVGGSEALLVSSVDSQYSGSDLTELDPSNRLFGQRLHAMFGWIPSNKQVSADYVWMPPLETNNGLIAFKNIGNFMLEVHGESTVDPGDVGGEWIMLFDSNGELKNDIYLSHENRVAQIVFRGDLDGDGRMKWLLLGALITPPGRDKRGTSWQDVEKQYENGIEGELVKLYVMNDSGVLEHKRGRPWFSYYKIAVNRFCPFKGVEKRPGFPSQYESVAEWYNKNFSAVACLSSLEGTGDLKYIRDSIQQLEPFPMLTWPIGLIVDVFAEKGYPVLKSALQGSSSNEGHK